MWGKLIVLLSLAFQVAASVVSLRLFKVPRRHPCVFLIAGVMILMVWRRLITFIHILSGNSLSLKETVFESLGLAISVFLFLSALWAVPRLMQFISEKNELLEKHSKASQIIRDLAIPAFVIDRDHTVIHWNRACEKLTGIPAEEMVGTRSPWRAFYNEERPVLADMIVDQASAEDLARLYGRSSHPSSTVKDGWEAEFFLPALNGGRWLFFSAGPLYTPEGEICGSIETFQDTTSKMKTGIHLSRSTSRLRTLHDIVKEISGEKTVKSLLDRAASLLKEEMNISNVTFLENTADKRERDVRLRLAASSSLDADTMERLTIELQRSGLGLSTRAAVSRKNVVTANVWEDPEYIPFFDGTFSEIDVPILDGEQVLGVISVEGYAPFDSQDEELFNILAGHPASLWRSIELVSEVECLALTDQLTGLPNRHALFQRLCSEENRLLRYGGRMSVLMMDMTRFKEINDTYGHMMGDDAMRASAACIRDCLRGSDFVARFGGDEFVALLPETGSDEASLVVERISKRLSDVRVSGIPLDLRADFGLALFPDDGKKMTTVIQKADNRMYENKAGRVDT
ncbi:MAG: diguanylate cyclase [Thermovirgaceae bacterium]|jgi:diguanylate cyclase (GGDEF)-like protein|nr:diguanylate cyclase [Synergistota bacterium]MDY0178627.1 diguanylate cyclase [Synergistaceae bacterium]NLV65068.1 diguanylate cyclase [Synergistaceae bacterium]